MSALRLLYALAIKTDDVCRAPDWLLDRALDELFLPRGTSAEAFDAVVSELLSRDIRRVVTA